MRTIRAKRVMNTVRVSPGGFVPRGDVGDVGEVGGGGGGGERGEGRARPFMGSFRDRDRDARRSPFSTFSISVSVCVANCGPDSTSPAACASAVPLTYRFVRAAP